MGTATLVCRPSGFRGDVAVYRLDPALNGHQHVLVSAINDSFAHETYIFACDAEGDVLSWSELPGSFRGDCDHEGALRGAGYNVVHVETLAQAEG